MPITDDDQQIELIDSRIVIEVAKPVPVADYQSDF
jgi:hypothetical protein